MIHMRRVDRREHGGELNSIFVLCEKRRVLGRYGFSCWPRAMACRRALYGNPLLALMMAACTLVSESQSRPGIRSSRIGCSSGCGWGRSEPPCLPHARAGFVRRVFLRMGAGAPCARTGCAPGTAPSPFTTGRLAGPIRPEAERIRAATTMHANQFLYLACSQKQRLRMARFPAARE